MNMHRSSSATTILPVYPRDPAPPFPSDKASQESAASKASAASKGSAVSKGSKVSQGSKGSKRPSLTGSDSANTLTSSAADRMEAYQDSIKEEVDTYERLTALRALMAKDQLDYYIIPSEDAHQSEYVAANDKRRAWISGFTGSSGQAIISKTAAYLVTDSRYWRQAERELDDRYWIMIPAGNPKGPTDWIEWLTDRSKDGKVGIDARMISHEKASQLQTQLQSKNSKLAYPSQNLVDLIWKDRPARSKKPVFVQPIEYTGMDAGKKLAHVRAWIQNQAPSLPSFSKSAPTPAQMHVGTLVSSLTSIAYVLNLRGDDVPYNPVFLSYLYIGLDRAVLFIENAKVEEPVREYLRKLNVELREYNDIWSFLRRREWGEGKVLIAPQTSYAISLMLTHFRYTVAPPIIDEMKGVKNEVEIQGLKRAYLRDGASFVQFLAWLEEKMSKGFQVSEWEAAWRLTEYRSKNRNYMGLAYENISATGPNAALPHYSPRKSESLIIDKETPYLNDSGAQYRDGTCDTTRTVHFGRPSPQQCEAYTRVLQGHISIDSAIFPKNTTGRQLDVLARKHLWQDGLNYLHGTGHGIGSFLSVHEGLHSFSNDVPLVRGHVITNEPGFYLDQQWGIRIESALVVRDVETKHAYNGDVWFGFERLTCVPIQTKMVQESMLSKEEKDWIRDHNRSCLAQLEPLLQHDKRALKWLRREAERPIGVAPAGPGGVVIDWD
ncbi:Creatinase/aminopeptidase [Artomyces pyxidatus]|uniref:Creatinase/aminopeptidase n=1 Tax=Artomyces pyxidatus TaxID=48021 RepID=A0ACB8TCH7_9AGAM|nr:Creatinase/aminopeptidase [Artomyces pyxidatus]